MLVPCGCCSQGEDTAGSDSSDTPKKSSKSKKSKKKKKDKKSKKSKKKKKKDKKSKKKKKHTESESESASSSSASLEILARRRAPGWWATKLMAFATPSKCARRCGSVFSDPRRGSRATDRATAFDAVAEPRAFASWGDWREPAVVELLFGVAWGAEEYICTSASSCSMKLSSSDELEARASSSSTSLKSSSPALEPRCGRPWCLPSEDVRRRWRTDGLTESVSVSESA